MRLLLNGMPALGAYTGVGYYAWHLLDQLSRRPEVEELGVFVGWEVVPWPRFATRVLDTESAGPLGGVGLRQLLRALIPPARRAYGRMRARAFRRAAGDGRWSLYHEPNYIPLPFPGPVVVTVHDLSFRRTPQFLPSDRLAWLKENLSAALARADLVVTNSEFTRRELVELYPALTPERVRAIHLGVDERFSAAPDAAAGEGGAGASDTLIADLGLPPRFLLFVGTLEPRKNLQGLLKAHAALPPALQREYPLVVTGGRGWRQRYFWKDLELLRLRGTVRTLGYVPHALVPALMRAATALCYPSHYEGFGLCPLQAAACGTAVVAADIPPLRETLDDAALFADPRAPESIAAQLRRMIEDEPLRQSLREAARRRAAQFTWPRCAERTLAVYRELLG